MINTNDSRLIRRRNGFSDRNNINPISKDIQYFEFEKHTRIKLKNFSFKIIDNYQSYFDYYEEGQEIIAELFADGLFCIETRGKSYEYERIEKLIKQVFDDGTYDEILDIIEFIASNLKIRVEDSTISYYSNLEYSDQYENLYKKYNDLFEKECVGYRFVDGLIVRITNKEELQAIEKASLTNKKVNDHIKKAILYISESGEKDYKNSIKESITALETLCSILTKKDKGTLGETIEIIGKEKKIHPALKEAIAKLYGFASDEPGIRHGSGKVGNNISFDDAKFVLVICSAIINYFIGSIKD